jgi:hypothetical protein
MAGGAPGFSPVHDDRVEAQRGHLFDQRLFLRRRDELRFVDEPFRLFLARSCHQPRRPAVS